MTQSKDKILLGSHTYLDKYLSTQVAETALRTLFDKIQLGIPFEKWYINCRIETNIETKSQLYINDYYGINVERTLDFDPIASLYSVTFNVYKVYSWYQELTTKKIESDIDMLNTTSYLGIVHRAMHENYPN